MSGSRDGLPDLTIGRDRYGKPLATWNNAPGWGGEYYPDKLRAWAKVLLDTADRMDRLAAADEDTDIEAENDDPTCD